jgi:TRAP-type C4-dicarboxylate transport system permease small subunit
MPMLVSDVIKRFKTLARKHKNKNKILHIIIALFIIMIGLIIPLGIILLSSLFWLKLLACFCMAWFGALCAIIFKMTKFLN